MNIHGGVGCFTGGRFGLAERAATTFSSDGLEASATLWASTCVEPTKTALQLGQRIFFWLTAWLSRNVLPHLGH
jgi:hypothetical protein